MASSSGYGSYPHISNIPTRILPRPQRTWPALLTLFLLAPIIPEMLTGSTPPLMFINPISLLFETGLYGSGAILNSRISTKTRTGLEQYRLACSDGCKARKTYN